MTKYGKAMTSPELTKYGKDLTSPDSTTKYGDKMTESLLRCNQCSLSFDTFSELHSHLLLHSVAGTPGVEAALCYCNECDSHFSNKLVFTAFSYLFIGNSCSFLSLDATAL